MLVSLDRSSQRRQRERREDGRERMSVLVFEGCCTRTSEIKVSAGLLSTEASLLGL